MAGHNSANELADLEVHRGVKRRIGCSKPRVLEQGCVSHHSPYRRVLILLVM